MRIAAALLSAAVAAASLPASAGVLRDASDFLSGRQRQDAGYGGRAYGDRDDYRNDYRDVGRGWDGRTRGGGGYAADAEMARRAQVAAALSPYGEPIRWSNPGTGNGGVVRALGAPQPGPHYGQLCRDLAETVVVNGVRRESRGGLCLPAHDFR